ncbi:hypothetical protein MKX01_011654 [Papaver californicum]|nr:hypothetical protein MKX01_011654 [Papaver californicum]
MCKVLKGLVIVVNSLYLRCCTMMDYQKLLFLLNLDMGSLAFETQPSVTEIYLALGLNESRKRVIVIPRVLSLLSSILERSVQKTENLLVHEPERRGYSLSWVEGAYSEHQAVHRPHLQVKLQSIMLCYCIHLHGEIPTKWRSSP